MIIAILQAEILRCIFLLFFLFALFFYLTIISFGKKMQRRAKAAHNGHYLNIKEEKKRRIKKKKKKHKHLFENVITIDFYNLVYLNLFVARMYICLDICFLFIYLFFDDCVFFLRPRGVPNKINTNFSSGNKYWRHTYEQNANQRSSATALTKNSEEKIILISIKKRTHVTNKVVEHMKTQNNFFL